MFDKYGRVTGYGQIAPGRDVEEYDTPGRPGRPRIGEAIGAAVPVKPPQATFRGAQQTLGVPPNPSPIDSLFGNANDAGQTTYPYPVDPNDPTHGAEPGGYSGAPLGRREPGGVTGGTGVQDARQQNAIDSSHFNTKGYAVPQYVAQNAGGVAPSGWDQTKWADPNYQDPKYAVGRIEMEASGGDGVFNTPEEKQRAVDNILKAYPKATFDGKDMIDFHDGGAPVDIFVAASTGTPRMGFAPQDGGGGAGNPMGASGAPFSPFQNAILGTSPMGVQSDADTYAARLRAQIMAALGANPQLAAIAQSRGLGF